jgi:hypothetical protein
MDQGVTRMMKEREMAERLLTKLARLSAFILSCMGCLATTDPIIIGRAETSALLYFN